MNSSDLEASTTRRLRRWFGQPLLQFLFIGAAIFTVAQLLDDSSNAAARTIVVDTARTERLAQLYQVQMGSAPSSADLEYLVDSYIRDETLYREALQMGLDRDDEIIRRRLIQKMEFLHNDLATVPEPDEDELRQHHARHSSQFTAAGTASFVHIYYSADVVGDEQARRAAEAQLATLANEDGEVDASVGDVFPLQRSYAELSEQDAAQIFGRTPFIQAVYSVPERQWSGPVRSGYGWHLIFVGKRTPSVAVPFEQSRDRVREAYIAERKRVANEQSYEALRARYKVVRSAGGSGE
jgi:peptidyl-prolyl cis-trans isomerase C